LQHRVGASQALQCTGHACANKGVIVNNQKLHGGHSISKA
jgi:hypothetical protein